MSFYLMERGWQESDVFANEAYTEREAWEWIISAAFYEPGIVNIKGNPVKIEVGQLSHSLRFMAEKFGWKKDKVSRSLKKFEKFGMIATANHAGQLIITICNYSKYQRKHDSSATQNATAARQDRDSTATKNKEIKQSKNNNTPLNPPKGKTKIKKPDGVSDEVWKDVLQHRVRKKAPLTETALQGMVREAERAGWPLESAFREMLLRGWQGIKAEWLQNSEKPEAAAPAQQKNDWPDWKHRFASKIGDKAAGAWFSGAEFDGKTLTVPKAFQANHIRSEFADQLGIEEIQIAATH